MFGIDHCCISTAQQLTEPPSAIDLMDTTKMDDNEGNERCKYCKQDKHWCEFSSRPGYCSHCYWTAKAARQLWLILIVALVYAAAVVSIASAFMQYQ